MKSYVIHLIRNAPCQGNLEGRYIGRTESPLSREGIRLLLRLKQEADYPCVNSAPGPGRNPEAAPAHTNRTASGPAGTPGTETKPSAAGSEDSSDGPAGAPGTETKAGAVAFYASPSTRCVDSLKILYPGAEPEVILEMAECDFGDWENRTGAELDRDPRFRAWLESGSRTAPPNGESSAVFMQRVCAGFEMLVQNLLYTGTTTAVLCTHGGVIMTLLSMYGLPKAPMLDWACDPGRGYSVRITPNLWMRGMVMEVFQRI